MLERLNLAVRLRDPWEAVDLGFILMRSHWRAVMGAWLSLVIPLVATLFLLFRNHLWVPPLVLWWLMPALDRIVLHVLAKATFGEVPTLRETLRHSQGYFRHGLLAGLLWRRFSPQRSFVLPIWQLEEQPGAAFRKRGGVLLRRGRVQAVFLTFVCFSFHFVLFLSALAALSLFTPKGTEFEVMDAVFGSGSERVRWVDGFLSLLPVITLSILEPFYVAGGFALYLNRRVELEGWDLEVAFRNTARRILNTLGRSMHLLLLIGCLGAFSSLQAQPVRPTPEEALTEVLKQPEFQVKQKKRGLHWKDQGRKDAPQNTPLSPDIVELMKLLGTIAKWVIIALAALAILYVLWRNRGYLTKRLRITSEDELPETLFGMDIRPEALPPGLDRVAARLWAAGRIRQALALLYRGALAHLVHRQRVSISRGATEGDCLRRAREALSAPAADYFCRLTGAWLQVAYADLSPGRGSESLCTEWPEHFQENGREVRR